MPKIEIIELHMAAAHFPIALLISNALFDAAGRFWKKEEFRAASYWIHLLGVVSGAVTVLLGSFGNPFLKDTGFLGNPWQDYGHAMTQKAVQHSWVGISSLLLFAVLAACRVYRKDEFSKIELALYITATALAIVMIGWTGYLGSHVMD